MKEIATLNFNDVETGDAACIVVRGNEGSVGFTISLCRNGDVEVFIDMDTAKKLALALNQALLPRSDGRVDS